MSETGITDLYHQLVEKHLLRHRQGQLLPLPSDKVRKKKQLFSAAYDILLFRSRIREKKNSSENELSEVNQLLGHVFRLRWQRKFDAASRLDHSLDVIKHTVDNDDTVKSMLNLILKLAGTGPTCVQNERHMPVICHSTKSKVVLPDGPLDYGDSRVLYTDSMYYTMYRPDAFTPNILTNSLDMNDFQSSLLKSMPGVGVSKFFRHDENEKVSRRNNARTLFGALVEGKGRAVNPWTKLDLPGIEEGVMRIRVPPCHSPTLTDEGRQTGNDESSLSTIEEDTTDIWEQALSLPSRRGNIQNWERVSLLKPYITELGRDALNHLYWYHQDLLAIVDPDFIPVRQLYITLDYLQRDIRYLILGLPSRIFMLDQTEKRFRIRPGICLSGTSPEAFSSLMSSFLECGSLFYRLTLFAEPPTLNSFYTKGLVHQAFTTAVRKYLRVYESFVLTTLVEAEPSIHRLHNKCHHLIKQVRFLAQICRVSYQDSAQDEVPTGLRLLTYLYHHSLASSATPNYRILLSFLKTSSVPYVTFIQKWIYHGVCHDPYEEFMIKVNNDYLYCRDKYYWTQGYELVKPETGGSKDGSVMSLFLDDIMPDIYNCGRAVNLLKLCCPQHFLCNLTENDVPRLSVTYDLDQLERIKVNTILYVSRVQQITRRGLISRKEMLERQERARFDLIQKGRQEALQHMEKVRQDKQRLRSAIQEKKRKQLQELRLEMEKDQDRKQALIEQQKVEDKAYMESIQNQDYRPKTELELRLEEQVKEELVRHYERMTVDALLRERRALWKVERAKLTQERNALIRNEQELLKNEYDEFLAARRREEAAMAHDVTDGVIQAEDDDHMTKLVKEMKQDNNVVGTGTDDVTINEADANDDDIGKALDTIRQDGRIIASVNDVTVSINDVTVDNLLDITSVNVPTSSDVINVGKNILDMTVPDVGSSGLLDTALPKWAQGGSDVTKVITGDSNDTSEGQVASGDITKLVAGDSITTKLFTETSDTQKLFTETSDSKKHVSETSSDMPSWAQKRFTDTNTLIVQSDDIPPTSNDGENSDSVTPEPSEQAPEVRPAIRTAIEPSTEVDRKSSTRAVSGRHIGQTNFSFRDMAPEPYEITVPTLRPLDEILNDTMTPDTSFEICRRTSFYNSPVKNPQKPQVLSDKVEDGSEMDARAEKFLQRNRHGHHPSKQTTEEYKEAPPSGRGGNLQTNRSTDHLLNPDTATEGVIDAKIVRFRQQNVHGHASDSKLKIQDGSDTQQDYASEKQSAFAGKPQTESETEISKRKHVSDQTDNQVDLDTLRMRKFQQQNKAGHSTRGSKSSVQKLLYGENFGTVKSVDNDPNDNSQDAEMMNVMDQTNHVLWLGQGVEPYQDNYDQVYESPNFDMAKCVYQTSTTYENADAEDTSAQKSICLPILIKRSIVGPILAQISLTNRSLVTYFFQDLVIDRHFEALKLFMFLEDGEFGQTLGDVMFEKLAHDPLPHEVFNTVFLSGALIKALRASNLACSMSEHLLLGNKYLPRASEMNGPRTLDCLHLHYQVNWPLNIVITDSCLLRYNMIFCFMLQLKRVAWSLNNIWYTLKRHAATATSNSRHKNLDLSQFRILQLYRHEMQNFVRVVQAYLSNQIIHVSWREFQQDLMENVNTLDDLHDVHVTYLNKAVFRCLLSKKAGSMMKVIQDILGLILKFHSQLMSAGWQTDDSSQTGAPRVKHPMFDGMKQTYTNFRDYSMFLFKVIRKVTARGYQPHLEELLLRLNFNAYYTNRQRIN